MSPLVNTATWRVHLGGHLGGSTPFTPGRHGGNGRRSEPPHGDGRERTPSRTRADASFRLVQLWRAASLRRVASACRRLSSLPAPSPRGSTRVASRASPALGLSAPPAADGEATVQRSPRSASRRRLRRSAPASARPLIAGVARRAGRPSARSCWTSPPALPAPRPPAPTASASAKIRHPTARAILLNG